MFLGFCKFNFFKFIVFIYLLSAFLKFFIFFLVIDMLRTKVGGKKYNELIIRLKQKGCVHYRLFDIVLVVKTANKSGFILERIGFFNPNINERALVYDSQRIAYWTRRGALVHSNIKKLIAKSLFN